MTSHFKPRGIGFYLITLIVLAVVPLVVIAAVLVARQNALQRMVFERSLLQTSVALSVAVDRQLSTYRVMLETLGQAGELDRGDMPGLYALATRVAGKNGALFISLFDRNGKQLFNTLRPVDEELPTPFATAEPGQHTDRPPVGDPTALKQVLRTAKTVNSDLLYGLVARRLLFTINVPILRGGDVAYILNAGFVPEVMTQLLHDNPQFSGVPAVIYDRRGFIVGRWRDADKLVGSRISTYDAIRGKTFGVGEGRTIEGLPVYYSYAWSATTGWGVHVGIVRTSLDEQIRTNWGIGALLAALGLAIGVALALILASRLRNAIVDLARPRDEQHMPQHARLRTSEILQLEEALSEAERARDAEATERELRIAAEARELQAQDANLVKDRFIAVLSHELRNPLAPIRNAIALVQRFHTAGDAERMQHYIDMADRQVQHLSRLVNDLLDVVRINTGTIPLQQGPVDLRNVAKQAVELAAAQIQAHHHTLTVSMPSDSAVNISGDFTRLVQVVCNLLDNAAKFTPDGGNITLALSVENNRALLRVIDDGPGIDERTFADTSSPFGAYSKIAQPRIGGGLGIGLSIAKSLVEAHGGTLVARRLGASGGSEFTISLPMQPAVEKNLGN